MKLGCKTKFAKIETQFVVGDAIYSNCQQSVLVKYSL